MSPVEAHAEAKRLHREGRTYDQIAAKLKEDGYLSAKGRPLTASGVCYMLKQSKRFAKLGKPERAAKAAPSYAKLEAPAPPKKAQAFQDGRMVFIMGTPDQIRSVMAGGGL